MALKKQVIPIPMEAGIDAGKDTKVGGGWTRIENGVFNRRGAVSKRHGQDRSTGTVDGDGLHRFGDSVLAVQSGEKIQLYNPAADTVTDITSHDVYFLEAESKSLAAAGSTTGYYPEVVRNGNVTAVKNHETVWSYIGDVVVDTQAIDYRAKFVVIGGLIRCYWSVNPAGVIKYVEIAATGAIGAPVTITDGSGNPSAADLHDACVVENSGGNPYVFIVYEEGSEFEFLTLDSGDNNATITTVLDNAAAAVVPGVACCFPLTDTTATIAWSDSAHDIFAAVYNVSSTRTVGPSATSMGAVGGSPFTVTSIVSIAGIGLNPTGGGDAGTIYATDEGDGGGVLDELNTVIEIDGYDNSGTYEENADEYYYNVKLYAEPCEIDSTGHWLVPMFRKSWNMWRTTDLQSVGLLYTGGPESRMKLSGKFLSGTINPFSGSPLPTMHAWSGGIATLGAVVVNRPADKERKTSYYKVVTSGSYSLVEIAIDHHTPTSVESDGLLYLSGLLPTVFDGVEFCEQGFIYFPEDIEATDNGSGSAWKYLVTYEKVHATGHVDQSSPSAESADLADTGSGTTLNHREISTTLKTGVKVVYWRTLDNGTVWKRLVEDNTVVDGWYGSATDTYADTVVEAHQELYTTGGALEHSDVYPYSVAAVHEGRRFTDFMRTPNDWVAYSKKRVDKEVFSHNEFLGVEVTEQDGKVKALGSIHDKLIIWKESGTYATEGGGYNDRGGGTNYIEPYLLSSAIGCAGQRTIVRYPQGLMFQGSDGSFWSVTQSMQMQPVGDPVRYYTDTYTVVQGVSLDDQHRVVYLTSDGPALVYDWLHEKWTVYSNHASTSGIEIDGTLYRVDSSGYIWSEDSANYDDNAAYVSMKLETAWVNVAGIGGYARLYNILLIGHDLAAATLRVKIAYDNVPAWDDNLTFDLTDLQTFAEADQYGAGLTLGTYEDNAMVLKIYPSRQKCTSFRLQISDEQHTGQTAGYDLAGMALVVGLKRGAVKFGTSRILGGP